MNQCPFKPPYPKPHKNKSSVLKTFLRGGRSWLHVLFEKSYKMKTGKVFLPGLKAFMIVKPDLVKKVMVDEVDDYPKHRLMDQILRPLLGQSIFTTNGEKWLRQRQMMADSFSHTNLKKVFPLMLESVNEMIGRLRTECSNRVNINADMQMTHITADIIFRTILSHPLKAEEAENIFLAFNKFQEISQKIMLYESYKLPRKHLYRKSEGEAAKIRDVLAPIIKIRYDNYLETGNDENNDILSSLMKARDDKDGSAFGYDELVDHVSMLFLAGHETSASALTWGLYLLSCCPEIQQKIYQEVHNVIADDKNGDFKYEDIRNLNYTRAVFNEVLRLYPPVGFFQREAAKNKKIRDKNIRAGDSVIISPWLMQRHREHWDNPDAFCPQRFSNENDNNNDKEAIKNSYIPFGMGQRICIGKGFAMQEAILIIAAIVKNFEVENIKGQTPEPVGRVTIRPEKQIMLKFSERK